MLKLFKLSFLFLLIISFDLYTQEDDYQNFSLLDGLSSTAINDIQQDKIGYLWLATLKGFSKFDGKNFTNFNKGKANCIYIHNNKTYIGLKKGLLVIEKSKSTFFESKEILKITSRNNKIIVATIQGISELRSDYIQPLNINTQVDFSIINDIKITKEKIYVASNKGFWILNGFAKPIYIKQLSKENCTSILIDDKDILIGTKSNGIKIIKNDKIKRTINTLLNITAIKKVNDEIWISSKNDGIEILEAKTYAFKRKINKYNSDISGQINTVFKDSQNSIWLASVDKGLYKTTLNTPINIKKPQIEIEEIFVNYNAAKDVSNGLNLKPDENNISFSLKSIDLQYPKSVFYRYQLKDAFTPWTSQNKVDLASLNPGKYNIKFQSKIGNKLSNIKSYQFNIDAPLYKKGWFIISSITLLLFVSAFIIDYRIKQIQKKNKKEIDKLKLENHLLSLEQKALQLQMNPHFIFNVLNGIKALGNSGKSEELNKTISQFSILLRSILNNSRLEEINLKEEITTIGSYLQLEQQMNSKAFRFSISTKLNGIDAEEILIPPMLLQPFIENSIEHGFTHKTINPNVNIIFEVKNRILSTTIEDNGIGFHQSKKGKEKSNYKSVALEVTKERIQNLSKNSDFTIEEIKDKNIILGTKVSFKIPLVTDY